jgi:predicted nucleotidyltransferase
MKTLEDISLKKQEHSALRIASDEVKKRYPVETLILYGSKARGDSDEYSDMDLLLIASRSLDWKEERSIIEMLFDIGMEHDVIFSTVFASRDEWDKGIFLEFPLRKEIVEDGVLISES